MVKLADRISNLQPPPRHWSKDRIRDYHREAQVIHDALKDASAFLAGRLRLKIKEYAAFVA
jgi:(p)ppGpp synthase/HD superfamily hydrolase